MTTAVDRVVIVTSKASVAIQCHAALHYAAMRDTPYTVLPSFEPATVKVGERCLVILDEDSLPEAARGGAADFHVPNCLFVIVSARVTPPLVAAALVAGARGVLSKSLTAEDASAALDEIGSGAWACRFDAPPELARVGGEGCWWCTPLEG